MPSFPHRKTLALPSFPHRETLRNRHSHTGRPLHYRHSRAELALVKTGAGIQGGAGVSPTKSTPTTPLLPQVGFLGIRPPAALNRYLSPDLRASPGRSRTSVLFSPRDTHSPCPNYPLWNTVVPKCSILSRPVPRQIRTVEHNWCSIFRQTVPSTAQIVPSPNGMEHFGTQWNSSHGNRPSHALTIHYSLSTTPLLLFHRPDRNGTLWDTMGHLTREIDRSAPKPGCSRTSESPA